MTKKPDGRPPLLIGRGVLRIERLDAKDGKLVLVIKHKDTDKLAKIEMTPDEGARLADAIDHGNNTLLQITG